MRVVIRGKDRTDFIASLGDEESVAAYFEQVRDTIPVGDESLSNLSQRNNSLLSAMLTVLAESKQESLTVSGAQEAASEASEEAKLAFDYSTLEEDSEGATEAIEEEPEYSELNTFFYG
ncbi:hypothetical protein KW516_19265 [Vibrio fluvialis]|nr:hypothetical protein [Vibrio fluvialis]